MLKVEQLHTYYGESHVLQGIDLFVAPAQCVAVLGRNGAGKTTTMRSVLGLTPARRGRITLDQQAITRTKTHRIARSGVAFVASGRRVFGSLTVSQNLELAARTLGRRRAQQAEDDALGHWGVEEVLE